MPGYESGRPAASQAASQGGTPATGTSSYGSAASGATGKGPVRGYPPVPGQPPPMYPPGQFAAWNRQPGGPRKPSDPGQQPGRSAAERDLPGPRSDPGYSVLAISDPAADVTSTQTWQAVDDGRSTGTWTIPARPDSPLDSPEIAPGPRGPGRSRNGTSLDGPSYAEEANNWPTADRASATGPMPRRVPTGRERSSGPSPVTGDAFARAEPGAASRPPVTGAAAAAAGTARAGAGAAAAAAGTAPAAADAALRPDTSGPAGTARRAARGHSGAHTSPQTAQRPSRKRPANVKVAVSAALLLVLAAAGALAYVVLHHAAKPTPTTLPPKVLTSTPPPQPSPTLGVYGHIGSRTSDPQPLTIGQLYPASFSVGHSAVIRTVSRQSRHCGSALVGSSIQSAFTSAGCSQVVRATYLGASLKMMGTIGVFNLKTGQAAKKAARSAGAVNFVAQLRSHKGLTSKIGKGTGIEEAAAKGHYLILIWAEFTNLRKPKNAYQREQLVRFITQLRDNTANVSLATRMATGTP
ncbi:MAG TPA: hypothetical protein VGI66_17335 [Streptosporangiaceae bacterium]